jgi:hypothetical protein
MSEAIFGLIGVIVGGVLQGGTAWWMDRRREDWAAHKAGRLFAYELGAIESALEHAVTNPMTYGELSNAIKRHGGRSPASSVGSGRSTRTRPQRRSSRSEVAGRATTMSPDHEIGVAHFVLHSPYGVPSRACPP